MLDIIWTLFNTIIHTIETLITIITSIPVYIGYFIQFMNRIPAVILGPLMIAFTAAVIIKIKRLVI